MTNDAKLGMLAGVLGVVVAAVFFAKQPPQPPGAEPHARQPPAAQVAPPAAPGAQPEAGLAALPSTPVPRTRKDVAARPTSRQAVADDEP